MGSYCGHKICDHSSLMERFSYCIEQIHNTCDIFIVHSRDNSAWQCTHSHQALVKTRRSLQLHDDGSCPVVESYRASTTAAAPAAAAAAAAAAARNCTQTPQCLRSKFRDADDERECGSAFFSQIPWTKLFSSA